jgi:chromosome partitioning protein
MPTIVIASSKGGSGKSTSAILLASALAEQGATVTVIDADLNHPLSDLGKQAHLPDTLTVLSDVSEDSIIDTIEEAAAKTQFVVVDLEGTASLMVGLAISRADLVIIPTQGSRLDAKETAKTVRLVRIQEKSLRTPIPAAILFTRTSSTIRPRTLVAIETEFRKAGLRLFEAQILELDAYKAIFSFGQLISKLDPKQVPNLPTAAANAKALMVEVVNLLKVLKAEAATNERAAKVA